MQTFNYHKYGVDYKLTVNVTKYSDGNTALQLLEEGAPFAMASINMPNVLLCDNEILVKDYSENEGILDFLVENNIVTKTQSGVEGPNNLWFPVCVINPKEKWGTPYERQPEPIEALGDKFVWEVEGYKLAAKTFKEAIELLPLIKPADL